MNLKFPDLPDFKASWAPLLWTPVVGSQERFMIGVITLFQGAVSVKPILSDRILESLYRKNNRQVKSLIDFSINALNDQAVSSIQELVAPITGLKIGKEYQTFCDGLDDLVEQAIMDQSSLVSPEDYRKFKIPQKNKRIQLVKEFRRNVKDNAIKTHPELCNYIDQQYRIGEYTAKYDFLSDRFICQYGLLREFSLTEDLNTAKQRLLDLTIFPHARTRGLILDCSLVDTSAENAVNSMAKATDVKFIKTSSPEETADVLIEENKAA